MASVHKSVLVPYSAAQMFALVERSEDYPRFLPWCSGAQALDRDGERAVARVDIDYEFGSAALSKVVGPVFNYIAESFIDAFVKRAEAVCPA